MAKYTGVYRQWTPLILDGVREGLTLSEIFQKCFKAPFAGAYGPPAHENIAYIARRELGAVSFTHAARRLRQSPRTGVDFHALRQTALTLAVQLHAARNATETGARGVEQTAASFVAYIIGEEKKETT